jgi:predicted DNA-binding protein
MGMTNKTKHLRIRLTEEQFNRLAEALIIKHKTKSSLVRDALNDYMDGTNNGVEKQNQKKNKNQQSLQ